MLNEPEYVLKFRLSVFKVKDKSSWCTLCYEVSLCLPVFSNNIVSFFLVSRENAFDVLSKFWIITIHYMFYPIITKLFWDGSVMSYTVAMLPMWCGLILSTDDTIAIRFACNPFDIIWTQMWQTVIMNQLIKSIGSRILSYIGLFYYLVSETIYKCWH